MEGFATATQKLLAIEVLLIQVLSSALIKYCNMTSITTSIKHIIKYDTVIHVAAEG